VMGFRNEQGVQITDRDPKRGEGIGFAHVPFIIGPRQGQRVGFRECEPLVSDHALAAP
jgi:hypothetical protein